MKTYICLLWVVFGCIGWEMHASVDVHPTFITTSDGLANNSVRLSVSRQQRVYLDGYIRWAEPL